MRHYEIVLIIHPDQSEQVPAMVGRYRELLTSQKGVVHRFEDWGRCQLAYPIQNVSKGHYLLLNIQCSHETLAELEKAFLFNDAVLRSLVMKMDDADTKSSPMLRQLQRDDGGRVAAGAEGG